MSTLASLIRFELVRRLRWRPLVLLTASHPVLIALTYGIHPESDPRLATDVAAMGMQLVWLFLISFELGRDRDLGMDALLTSNLVAPSAYVLSKLLALGFVLLAYHSVVLLVVASMDPGGVRGAWSIAAGLPFVLVLLPLALLTELVVPARVPMVYVALIGTATLLVAFWSGVDAETVASWSGLDGESAEAVRPAVLGAAGLIVLFPLAIRRAAAARPF